MGLQIRSNLRLAIAPVAFCILILATASNYGQTAAEFVQKAKASLESNQFDAAIVESTKAISLDSKNWTAYMTRGVARKRHAEERKTGITTTVEKSEWNSVFDDLAKAAELSDQDLSAYMEFYIFELKSWAGREFSGNPVFAESIRQKVGAFYAARIAENPHNVCARTFLIRNASPSELIRKWIPAVENFDNIHGGQCVGLAATRIAENLKYESGDREFNKKEAKRYYAIALKADPRLTSPSDDAIDTAFADAAPKASSHIPTATPSPVPTSTSVAEAQPTTPMVSAGEAARNARLDEFLKEYDRTMDGVAPLRADALNAMKKLLKASEEDLKYGTRTVNLYTGTKRRAQTQLDTIHRKYRDLIRKYEGTIPSIFINEVKKLDRSLPETVD